MSITAIRMTMEKIIDKPVTFLLLTIGIYLIVLALIAVVGYVIACTKCKNRDDRCHEGQHYTEHLV